MTYPRVLRSAIAMTAFAALSPSCSADSGTTDYPVLRMQGDTYQSACTPDHLSKLQAALLKQAVVGSDHIWRSIKLMLCAPKEAASRLAIKAILPSKVRQASESTGDEPSAKMITRSDKLVDEMFAEGRAWSANIMSEDGTVILQYFSNEACVQSRKLKWMNKKWAIVEIGEACD